MQKVRNIVTELVSKKPSKPRRPNETTKKTECIWSSSSGSTTLADLINLIPTDVPASNITVQVNNNVAYVSYVIITPNAKYEKQLAEYKDKLQVYNLKLAEWTDECAAATVRKIERENDSMKLYDEVKELFYKNNIADLL